MRSTNARRVLEAVIVAGVTLATVAACGSSTGNSSSGNSSSGSSAGVSKSAITIGTTNPLTGVAGSSCGPVSQGASAWFDHVNSQGGVNGRKIDSVVLDDAYQAPQALANARELVKKPVFGIFGGCGSIQPPAIQTVAKPASVPYIFPQAGLDSLVGDSNAFLLLPPFDKQLPPLVDYAMKKYGAGSLYIVAQQLDGVDDTISAVEKQAKASGGSVVGSSITTAGQADLSSVILKIKQAHPDYVVLAEGVDTSRLILQMSQQGAMPSKQILGFSNSVSAAVASAVGSTANGKFLAVSAVAPPGSSQAQQCVDVLRAVKASLAEDSGANYGCAAAQALVTALTDAGKNLTRQSFEKTLLGWNDKKASPSLPNLTFTEDNRVGETQMFLVTFDSGTVKLTGTVPLS